LRVVYYSLAVSADGRQERQWVDSVRSLRRHNDGIPVFLVVYGVETPSCVREEAGRSNAVLVELGDYASYLRRFVPQATALALYPTLHKILSLRHLPTADVSQVLYVDCDTFFFDNVEQLFSTYQRCDCYAREEPMTSRSRHGIDRGHVDEGALRRIAAQERLQPVAPFNSGVWLMNNGSWREVDRLRATFLEFVWRLLVGRYLAGGEETTFDLIVGARIVAAADEFDWARALPYPSTNGWIIDQVALWLALGQLPLSHGLLEEGDVGQGAELLATSPRNVRRILGHYFSAMERSFRETIDGS
jgi:hypothetical protein